MPRQKQEGLAYPLSLRADPFLKMTIEVGLPSIPEGLHLVPGALLFTDMDNKEFLVDATRYAGNPRKEGDRHFVDFELWDFEFAHMLENSTVCPLEWAELQLKYTLEEVSLSAELSAEEVIPYRFVELTICLYDPNHKKYVPQYTAPQEELNDLNQHTNWSNRP